MSNFIQSTDLKIGQTVRFIRDGRIEKVREVKGGYVNGFRADLWELSENTTVVNLNNLPNSMLTNICLGVERWNKKFYGYSVQKSIYINNKKYDVSFEQMEELSKHFEIDF